MVRKLLTNVWFQRIFGCLITAFALSVLIISAVSFVAEIWFDINIGFMLFATIFLLLLMLFLASIGLYAVNTKCGMLYMSTRAIIYASCYYQI